MAHRTGTSGTETVHLYNEGTLSNPRAICGYRGSSVTFGADSATCLRCRQAADALRARQRAEDRRRGR